MVSSAGSLATGRPATGWVRSSSRQGSLGSRQLDVFEKLGHTFTALLEHVTRCGVPG